MKGRRVDINPWFKYIWTTIKGWKYYAWKGRKLRQNSSYSGSSLSMRSFAIEEAPSPLSAHHATLGLSHLVRKNKVCFGKLFLKLSNLPWLVCFHLSLRHSFTFTPKLFGCIIILSFEFPSGFELICSSKLPQLALINWIPLKLRILSKLVPSTFIFIHR